MSKPVIAVDLDDVLANFNRAFLAHHNENYGTSVAYEDIKIFDLCAIYGIDRQTFVGRAKYFYQNFHDAIKPVEGSQSVASDLSEIYDLQIVTSRWNSLEEITKDWVNEWFPKTFSALHFVNKHPHEQNVSKSHTCQEIGAIVLIDDALHHIVDTAEAGISAILMNRPWNQGDTPDGVVRVHGWDEVSGWIHKNIKK